MRIPNRILLGVVAIVLAPLLLLGCSEDESPDQAETTPTLIVEEETATPEANPPNPATDAPPGTTVTAGGITVEMGVGTYCWTTMCVDMIGPITRDTLNIASGDEVVVAVPEDARALNEVSVEAFPAANPQVLDNGGTAWQPDFDHDGTVAADWDEEEIRIAVPLDPGTYVLVVGMFFEAGDVQYGVVLEVE
jgi:hypothetical protein